MNPVEGTTTSTPLGWVGETVLSNGVPVGVVHKPIRGIYYAQPVGRTGMYRFATRSDAWQACVSYAVLGVWKNEMA